MEYLLQLLIEKIENSENQWKPGANGWKSLSNKAGNLYDDRKHLKSDVVKAAKELEKTGLVKIEWVQGYREQDIQAIRYRQEDIPALYKLYRERATGSEDSVDQSVLRKAVAGIGKWQSKKSNSGESVETFQEKKSLLAWD